MPGQEPLPTCVRGTRHSFSLPETPARLRFRLAHTTHSQADWSLWQTEWLTLSLQALRSSAWQAYHVGRLAEERRQAATNNSPASSECSRWRSQLLWTDAQVLAQCKRMPSHLHG